MHYVDRCEWDRDRVSVLGWCFKLGVEVADVSYRFGERRESVRGYGQPSEDIAASFNKSLSHVRFDIAIDNADPSGIIEFRYADGSKESVSLALSEESRMIPLRHQIYDEVYRGKFRVLDADTIESVTLSMDSDEEVVSVSDFQIEKEAGALVLSFSVPANEDWEVDGLVVSAQLDSGEWLHCGNAQILSLTNDPAHRLVSEFIDWANASDRSMEVLEIGSRGRSGVTRKHKFDRKHRYIGIDVVEGENVDLVCDAHELSAVFAADSIDVIASYSVFEHLAMPWKVVIEMNKVMKVGARCMIFVPHTWPLHEVPFDFWRYSDDSWRALFNESTGFRILDSACGEPALIRPEVQMLGFLDIGTSPGYLCSTVVAEKTHSTRLAWDVPVSHVYKGGYPH